MSTHTTDTQCAVGAGSHTVRNRPVSDNAQHGPEMLEPQNKVDSLHFRLRPDATDGTPCPHITPTRMEDHIHTFCVGVILPWQLVDHANRRAGAHYTRQLYMCELNRSQEAMVMTQQQNTQNDRHDMVSTALTGCSN